MNSFENTVTTCPFHLTFWPFIHSASYLCMPTMCLHSVLDSEDLLLLFSHQVVSDSLWPHGRQHYRLPCPSPSPEVCPSSYLLNSWCHPTFSSSVAPFSFYLQSFPASGSFPVNRLFTTGGQSIGALASASVLPISIQGWFLLRLICLISLLFTGLSEDTVASKINKVPAFWSLCSNGKGR